MAQVPSDFISISELCSSIQIEMSYASSHNFTGEIVPGYHANKAFLAKTPADALCLVSADAQKRGLGLKILDGYRPVKAVTFFQDWALRPETNLHIKKKYYPKFTRLELFEQGYIAKQSSHSRGSAIDLTLFDTLSGLELDMGSIFDYFDGVSSTDSSEVTDGQKRNRHILRSIMENRGFKNFSQEWWHYSFRPEPHPHQYFDFDIE